MLRVLGTGRVEPKKIDRHEMPTTGTFAGRVRRLGTERISFGDLARFACPTKTAAWLAHVAQCDVRTAEKWLEGKHEPPAEAMGAIMFEIMRRFHLRAE